VSACRSPCASASSTTACSVHRRRRRALVPQPGRAARRRGPRGRVPDPAPMAPRSAGRPARRARRRARAAHRLYTADGRRRIDQALVFGAAAWRTSRSGAGATTSCTRPHFPTSRCWLQPRSGRRAATASWSIGTGYGRLTNGGSTSGAPATPAGSCSVCARARQRAFCFSPRPPGGGARHRRRGARGRDRRSRLRRPRPRGRRARVRRDDALAPRGLRDGGHRGGGPGARRAWSSPLPTTPPPS
jgi:hypothetical protein